MLVKVQVASTQRGMKMLQHLFNRYLAFDSLVILCGHDKCAQPIHMTASVSGDVHRVAMVIILLPMFIYV